MVKNHSLYIYIRQLRNDIVGVLIHLFFSNITCFILYHAQTQWCFIEVEVMSSMWICPEVLLGSTSRRPKHGVLMIQWCRNLMENIMDYVGMQGFPSTHIGIIDMSCFPFGMIRLIADDLWDSLCLSNATNILHFWSFVLQESPATWPHFSGRLLRYWSGNCGWLFEQLPGFLGGLIWRHTHLVAWFYTIWWCTIPKIHLENSPWTISIWKTKHNTIFHVLLS